MQTVCGLPRRLLCISSNVRLLFGACSPLAMLLPAGIDALCPCDMRPRLIGSIRSAHFVRRLEALLIIFSMVLGNDPSYEQNNSKMSKRRMRANANAKANASEASRLSAQQKCAAP
jgi:hypothetical protein